MSARILELPKHWILRHYALLFFAIVTFVFEFLYFLIKNEFMCLVLQAKCLHVSFKMEVIQSILFVKKKCLISWNILFVGLFLCHHFFFTQLRLLRICFTLFWIHWNTMKYLYCICYCAEIDITYKIHPVWNLF